MNDSVSRQAAIDEIKRAMCEDGFRSETGMIHKTTAYEIIRHLPPAEPEIIRCNSCKHWTQTTGKMKGYGLGRCDYLDADLVTCNGFCYWAERRNDNRD